MYHTTTYDPAVSSSILIQTQPVQHLLQVRFNADSISDWD